MNQTFARNLSVAATLLLIGGAVFLIYQNSLFSSNRVVISVQVASGLLMIWARFTFGLRSFHAAANPTEGSLITHGPYRFVRNPIYSAIWIFTWSGISVHLSLVNVLAGIVILIALGIRIACEESFLITHFTDYPAYAKRTARLIPFLL